MWLFVSGLTSRDHTGDVLHAGDAAAQARQILVSLKAILAEAGGDLTNVVRIVTYLTNIDNHPAVHEVRREFFGDDPPASTSVEVSRLYDERQLIEIEATAILV
jgi:enamine deaminase RidA (YjgF/YER057c/UK114 family)